MKAIAHKNHWICGVSIVVKIRFCVTWLFLRIGKQLHYVDHCRAEFGAAQFKQWNDNVRRNATDRLNFGLVDPSLSLAPGKKATPPGKAGLAIAKFRLS